MKKSAKGAKRYGMAKGKMSGDNTMPAHTPGLGKKAKRGKMRKSVR